MKEKLASWQLIKDSLDKNIPVLLLYVLESKGSSPGRQGFFMAVTADGQMAGSIGGGMMEVNLVEQARALLSEAARDLAPALIEQEHRKNSDHPSGMICSGRQRTPRATLR